MGSASWARKPWLLGIVVLALIVAGAWVAALLVLRDQGPDEANVFPGRDNLIASSDGRVTVQIGGDAVTDPGILTITPAPGEDAGWDIDLHGADLVGEAEIRFAVDSMEAGTPPPSIVYREAGQEPQLAADVQMVAGEVVVRTTHFSRWWEIDWGELKRGIVDAISRSVSISEDRAPMCAGQEEARERYSVDSDDGRRVYWCLGVEGDTTVLKAVNGRQYGVIAESTPGLRRTHLDTADILGQIAQLLTPPASLPANTVLLLPPGDRVEYEVSGEQPRSGVMFKPDPGAYLVSALEYAISTYSTVLKAAKVEGVERRLMTALNGVSCLQDLTEMMTTDLGSTEEATEFFQSALDTAFSCVELAAEDMDLGWILDGVVKPITWLVSGVKTAIMGFVAVGDIVLDVNGYQIILTDTNANAGAATDAWASTWEPFLDTWSGTIDQSGTAYGVEVTLYLDRSGMLVGRVVYPELDSCSGTWQHARLSGRSLKLVEHIADGDHPCVLEVKIRVTLSEDGTQLAYSADDGLATGHLRRGPYQGSAGDIDVRRSTWPIDKDEAPAALLMWLGANGYGLPAWVACDDQSDWCVADQGSGDAVVLNLTAGISDRGSIQSTTTDPTTGLRTLDVPAKSIAEILS